MDRTLLKGIFLRKPHRADHHESEHSIVTENIHEPVVSIRPELAPQDDSMAPA